MREMGERSRYSSQSCPQLPPLAFPGSTGSSGAQGRYLRSRRGNRNLYPRRCRTRSLEWYISASSLRMSRIFLFCTFLRGG